MRTSERSERQAPGNRPPLHLARPVSLPAPPPHPGVHPAWGLRYPAPMDARSLVAGGEEEALPPPARFDGLTALQSAFVRCYVAQGTGNATQAARAAGYSPASAQAQGHRLLGHRGVQRAILQHTQEAFAPIAPIALARMVRLALNARSEFVQQQAAKDILDRAGLAAPSRLVTSVAGEISITINLHPEGGGGKPCAG